MLPTGINGLDLKRRSRELGFEEWMIEKIEKSGLEISADIAIVSK